MIVNRGAGKAIDQAKEAVIFYFFHSSFLKLSPLHIIPPRKINKLFGGRY
jgi:hypothetical protein